MINAFLRIKLRIQCSPQWLRILLCAHIIILFGTLPLSICAEEAFQLHSTSDGSTLTARHEASAVVIGSNFYLIGGRGLRPIELLDTVSNKWSIQANSIFEINHFQPVVWGGMIYAIGAFTGSFPHETNVPTIKIYNPVNKTWSDGAEIPVERRRGATSAAVYNNKIYIHGGNTNGHDGGAVGWFDEYDPATNEWKILADSPSVRDHYVAAIVNNRFIAAGGRSTHYPNFLANKVAKVDSYNFLKGAWESGMNDIPTPRAGTSAVAYDNEVIVIGGEASVGDAESIVEALNINTGQWRTMPSLTTTRHGMGAGVINDVLYVASGNKVAGGGQELSTIETLALDLENNQNQDTDGDGLADSSENNIHHTNPNNVDTDADTLSDGAEVNTHGTNPLSTDTDGDTLSDGDEVNFYSTNPLSTDTDGDTLSDGDEVNFYSTNPLSTDTDGDSLDDNTEINSHNTNPQKADSDDDGLSDTEEISTSGTNPLKEDTDGDSIGDAIEINEYNTDPLQADSDDDSLSDAIEINQYSSNPNDKDTDNDGLRDDQEVALGTDLLDKDTDGDGYSDGEEVTNETDPNDADDPGNTDSAPTEEIINTGALGIISTLLLILIVLSRRLLMRRNEQAPIQ